ncbi:MAG: TraB/VirB10 family protein [Candidatus Micrarchaeia archaeon]
MNKEIIKQKFTEKWNTINPEKRRKIILTVLAVFLILFGIIGYYASRTDTSKTAEKKEQGKQEEIKLDSTLLQKTQLAESQKEIRSLKEQLEMMKKEKEEHEKLMKQKEEEEKKEKEKEQLKSSTLPPPMYSSGSVGSMPPPVPTGGAGGAGMPQAEPPQPKVEYVGDIKVVSADKKIQEKPKDGEQAESKKKQTIYLPPSFMEATLLSGLDAPAISKGEGNPVPALFRIKAPAVLPNSVKANLKGCFVIAEGLGSLADERAHLRLVNISCVGKKGQAVIDQKVKGFVVDNDGKIGLRGKVVSKMGSHLARTFIAGLFGGLAQVTGTQSYTYSVSGSGVVSTLNPGDAVKAGISTGITQTANALQKFYLELAQQTIPVIEIQATRNVTLVISEGVNIEIKEQNLPE